MFLYFIRERCPTTLDCGKNGQEFVVRMLPIMALLRVGGVLLRPCPDSDGASKRSLGKPGMAHAMEAGSLAFFVSDRCAMDLFLGVLIIDTAH